MTSRHTEITRIPDTSCPACQGDSVNYFGIVVALHDVRCPMIDRKRRLYARGRILHRMRALEANRNTRTLR